MIRHDFQCSVESCPHVELDVTVSASDWDATVPQHCGRPMEISYQKLDVAIKVFEAFETRNVSPDGRLMRIASKGDLEFAAREYGCRHDYDDPELVAEGGEIRKRGPRAPLVFLDMGRR